MRDALFSLAALFGKFNCMYIYTNHFDTFYPYLNICGYNGDYNIHYQDILYNLNVCRAEQTEAWTHLEWFLEQLFLS